jgi:hypothetical protein
MTKGLEVIASSPFCLFFACEKMEYKLVLRKTGVD